MKRCILAGPYSGAEAVYIDLARQLGLPGHFGANLDALWDTLVKDVPGPIEIVWPDFAGARRTLGAAAEGIRATLEEVAAERPDVAVVIGGAND
ncbi:MAG: barnase inhibitor [Alphaproteobacteria bacterium]|nr:barnase inhibitor [Alphaproteobacteria bacterium]